MRNWSHNLLRLTRLGPRSVPESPASFDGPGLDDAEIRVLIQFMSEIGSAMNGAGDATTFIRRSLQRIGQAYGLRGVGVFVVPTLLLLRYGDDRATFVDLSSEIPKDLRLEQIAELYQLVDDAEDARLSPAEGLARLRAILSSHPRFPGWMRVFALMSITTGIVLLLRPSWQELALSLALGFMVGMMKEASAKWPPLWPLVPAFAGLAVGTVALFIIDMGLDCRLLQVLIPPLATFLPGAALTVSMIELANGDIVAGGSRLAYGTARLFLLVIGLVVAVQWAGIPNTSPADPILLGLLLQPLGLLAFTVGVFVHFSAPKGSLPWLLLVIAVAWLAQQSSNLLLGTYSGGFVAGALMILVARAIQDRHGAPPLLVCYTPAFWLLVPGALGLEGLAQIVGETPQSGVDEILAMFVTMISIALGVLFGLMVSGSRRAREPL